VDAVLIYYLTLGAFNGSTLAGSTGGDSSSDALGEPSPPLSVWDGSSGESTGMYVFGTAVFTNMVVAMLLKVALLHASWNWTAWAGLLFSAVLYFGFIALYGSFNPAGDSFASVYLASYDFYMAPFKMFAAGGFWASCAMVSAVVSLLDLTLVAFQTQFFTSLLHSAREWEYVAVRHSAQSSAAAVVMPGAQGGGNRKPFVTKKSIGGGGGGGRGGGGGVSASTTGPQQDDGGGGSSKMMFGSL
jgi:hypothetical protein